jgi:hypothetical protein
MDIDQDNGSESYEGDDLTALSQTVSMISTPMGLTSGRPPLSMCHFGNYGRVR